MPDVREPEAVRYLLSLQPGSVKLGLERMRALCARLGHPEGAGKHVHVAGTNGKGSVCAMLASILQAAGYRTGLYTSPHLVEFRERIRVDGEMIPSGELEAAVARLRREIETLGHEGVAVTFFEGVTAMALDYFARAGCDVVVLETGLGGRLDSTNVVRPEICLLTRIGMDHQRYLGGTLEEIAREKAGIFKPGVPIVAALQEPGVLEIFRVRAAEMGSRFEVAGPAEPSAYGLSLAGAYQRENLGLVLKACELLASRGWKLAGAPVEEGLGNVRWPGRFQILRQAPPWVLDGAHNPQGLRAVLASWKELFGKPPGRIVFGCMKDKDHAALLEILRASEAPFCLVPVPSPRSLTRGDMPGVAWRDTLEEAWREEHDRPTRDGALFCGSLYLAGEVLALESGVPGQMEMNG